MIDKFLFELWYLTKEMSPYLIFGFLVAGILSVMISEESVKKNLGGKGIWPIVKSALFGIPLPLCSCGVIPVATSLYKNGASKSATTSFLISTPQTGVDSILVTYSLLVPIFTIIRPITALAAGIIGGVASEVFDNHSNNEKRISPRTKKSNKGILRRIYEYGFISLPQDIGKPLISGIFIAAFISLLVPDDFFASNLDSGLTSLIVIIIISIPIYVCATASIPIALALMLKGLSPGAAFVFLMTGPATNSATISTIWNILGKKATLIYLATVSGFSLLVGILMNKFMPEINLQHHSHNHWMMPFWIEIICTILFILILSNGLLRLFFPKLFISNKSNMQKEYDFILSVSGMTCNHCVKSVENAVNSVANVEDLEVILANGQVRINGKNLSIDKVTDSITSAGFSCSLLN